MIICAAVRIKKKDSEDIITIHCMRHHYAFEILRDLGFKHKDYTVVDEGFITHKGEYIERHEAYFHAVECGQLCAQLRYDIQESGSTVLFSEDLW